MDAIRHVVLTALVLGLASCSGQSDNERIAEVFQKYRTSLLADDGQAAWSVVDAHTQEYYAEALHDALSMPKADLDRLDFLHKFMILRLRHEFRKPELQRFTGEKIFVLGVTNGWISKATVQNLKPFHQIVVDGNYATAYIREAPDVPLFHFIKEKTGWKLALTKTFEFASSTMDQARQQSGLSERDYIIALLKAVSKYRFDEAIFEGPLD